MRDLVNSGGVTVNAIAGTHVVTLGLDLDDAARQGCLGFAIQREDHLSDERIWLKGMKTFAATDPGLGPGGQVSSREHPFQTFQWADYEAQPERRYTYTVLALYGEPKALTAGPQVSVEVTTESNRATADSPHTVFFNRGAVASQEYARLFQNEAPSKLEGELQAAAYKWLSRGLLEALLDFIARADGSEFGLYGAIYEFQWPQVLAALKAAAQSGADVSILYDDIENAKKEPMLKNEQAIADAGIESLTIKRTQGKIMHNKFLVLTRKEKDGTAKPIAVWTGSTNITENGLFGHLNCGHAVEREDVAGVYLEYWRELCEDRESGAEKAWLDAHNANPPDPWSQDLVLVFSPHRKLGVLDWYVKTVAGGAERALFMSFAFGMDKRFRQLYAQDDTVLRFALMDEEAAGSHAAREKAIAEIELFRKRANVTVAIGGHIPLNSFDRWLQERGGLTQGVEWIHTKFMLVDPLSENPVVVTGSANFSEPSTDENNENMLVIRGDTRVADIYLGEYMRLYSHYTFREAVTKKWGGETWNPSRLDPTDAWQRDYYEAGSERFLKREYFIGD
jgi:phosphatidylserine/phosphatidylglycerophosphate/cardiolipin synthase-like enzyme